MARSLNRNVLLMTVVGVLNSVGFFMPIATSFFRGLGLGQAEIALLQSIFMIANAVAEVPTGWMADRVWRGRTWRRECVMAGAVIAAAGFGIYAVAGGFGELAVAEVLLGVGMSFIAGADSAIVGDSLDALGESSDAFRDRYEARSMSWGGAATAVSNLSGGWLAGVFGQRFVVAVSALPYLAMAYLTSRAAEPPVSAERLAAERRPRMWRRIIGDGELMRLMIYSAVVSCSTYTMVWLMQPYFEDVAGVPRGWVGLAFAAYNVALWQIASRRRPGRYQRRLGTRRTLASFVVLSAVSYLVLALGACAAGAGGGGLRVAVGAFCAVIGIGGLALIRALFTPVAGSELNKRLSSDVKATGRSVRNLIGRAFSVVLGPVVGWSYDQWHMSGAMLMSAVIYGVLGAAAYLWLRSRLVEDE